MKNLFLLTPCFLLLFSCGGEVETTNDDIVVEEAEMDETVEFEDIDTKFIIGNVDFEHELTVFIENSESTEKDGGDFPYEIVFEECARPIRQRARTKLKIGKLIIKFKKDEPVNVDGFNLEVEEISAINLYILTLNRFLHDGCVSYNTLLKMVFMDKKISNNELILLQESAKNLNVLKERFLNFKYDLAQASSKEDVLEINNSINSETENVNEVEKELANTEIELNK